MTGQKASLVERLCEAKNPRDVDHWKGRDGYYVEACRVSEEDVPGLIEIVRRWGDPNGAGDASESMIGQENTELLPVTAWRTLADLKADAAVEPLVDMLCSSVEFDDWVCEELPHVFGKIGKAAYLPLTRVVSNESKQDHIRLIAARGLRYVADHDASMRDSIVEFLSQEMANAVDSKLEFNSTLLVELVELRAVEAAESIERAFAGNLLDVGMMGNWEQVRQKLGVQGMGLKMPENPHNSIEKLRERLGIGIFSDEPIFMSGEVDRHAADAYLKSAYHTFSRSPEAKRVIERLGDVQWFQMLLRFGLNHCGETIDAMTLETVLEFVLDYVPRKVSTEADAAEAIILELTMFWEYLDRVYELPAAKSVLDGLKTPGLDERLKAKLSDPSNFGMAKSMVMSGRDAGYDMASEAGVAEFVKAYNRSLSSHNEPMVPSSQRIGRNDPCPCGSGKKFKKCCGNPAKRMAQN